MPKSAALLLTVLLALPACSESPTDAAATLTAIEIVQVDGLEPGVKFRFQVKGFGAGGKEVRLPTDLELFWESSNTFVLRVDEKSGVAEADMPGTATVTATTGRLWASSTVTVLDPANFTLDRSSFAFTQIGDTASVVLRWGQKVSTRPVLRVLDEKRWIMSQPVVDPDTLAAGRIRAAAPGTARLLVSLFGKDPDTVSVSVTPTEPLVVSVSRTEVGPGDTLRIHAYRASELGTVMLGSQAGTVVFADSATLDLLFPAATEDAMCGTPKRLTVERGGFVSAEPSIVHFRQSETRLEVGEPLRVESSTCVRLAGRAGARYALAYADFLGMDRARDGGGVFSWRTDSTTVRVQAGGVPGSGLSAGGSADFAPAAGEAAPAQSGGASAANSVFDHPKWKVGDTFLTDAGTGREASNLVLQVHGDYFVLAVPVKDTAYLSENLVATMDTALAFVLLRGVPMLQAALDPGRPITSTRSGQYLILLQTDSVPDMRGQTESVVRDRVLSFSRVRFGTNARDFRINAAGAMEYPVQEITHAWQALYNFNSGGGMPPEWAGEGGATYMRQEIIREFAGMRPLGNYSWQGTYRNYSRYQAYYFHVPVRATGVLQLGHDHAASFMGDMVDRLLAAGVPYAEATRTVMQGSLEDWFGYDWSGTKREGLTSRMRKHMGAAWDAEEAVLVWTASQALDERFPSDTFQNRSFYGISNLAELYVIRQTGWRGHGTLVLGSGASLEVRKPGGAVGFLFLDDESGAGTSLALSADHPRVGWMLVRYQ